MGASSSDLADFYHELALLVRAKLPLPDSLLQIGRSPADSPFRAAIRDIGERTARGETFSEIVRAYPRFFPPFHVRLVSAGESSGTLPETLLIVARLARFSQLMAETTKDIAAYPLFALHFCFVILFFLSVMVLPRLRDIFNDLGVYDHLPLMTAVIMKESGFVQHHWLAVSAAYLAVLAFCVWIYTPGIGAHRALVALIRHLPGSCRIARSLDSARFCALGSAFLRQRMPLHTARPTRG